MADVEIMMAQLRIIFNNEKEMDKATKMKMEKLRMHLDNHEKNKKKNTKT